MAEKIALELDVQTGKSVTNLGNLEKATQKLNKTIDTSEKETMTLQKQFDSLNKEIEEAPVNIRAMNKQIQQYQAIALEAGRTSPLGREAIQKAAALKDRYIDIQNEVNRLANDGVKLQAALDIGTTVVAGFTAFQGAMALSGVESEELRETMVKLQAAQSVLMGVETLRKNLEKESTLMLVAKNTAMKVNNALTVAATAVTKLFNKSVVATSFSFKALKAAILATGVGALVIGITSAIGAIADFVSGSGDAEEKQKELDRQLDITNRNIESQTKHYEALNEQIDINLKKKIGEAKLQDATGLDIAKLEIEAAKEKLELAKKAEKQASDNFSTTKNRIIREQNMLEAMRSKEVHALAKLHIKTYKAVQKAEDELFFKQQEHALVLKKEEEDSLKRAEEKVKKDLEIIRKRGQTDLQALHKLRLARKEADAETLEDFIAIEKMKRNHLLKNEKLTKNERRLIRFESEQEILRLTKEFAEKELEEKRKHEQNIADIRNEFLDELEDENEIYRQSFLTQQQIEIEAVEEKYFRLKELAKQNGEDITQLEFNEQKAKDKINEEFAQKELERQIALEDAKLSLASQGIGALMNLTTAFAKDNEKSQKKAFEINKRLQIAQAIIQTYQGANAIFAAAAANPKTVLFPAQPFIAAGLAVANGLANVATISKQQFQSSSAGGGGNQAPDFTGGAGTAPQLSPVTNTSTLVPQEPTQVFVTETDITNTQNQVAVIQGQATLS